MRQLPWPLRHKHQLCSKHAAQLYCSTAAAEGANSRTMQEVTDDDFPLFRQMSGVHATAQPACRVPSSRDQAHHARAQGCCGPQQYALRGQGILRMQAHKSVGPLTGLLAGVGTGLDVTFDCLSGVAPSMMAPMNSCLGAMSAAAVSQPRTCIGAECLVEVLPSTCRHRICPQRAFQEIYSS